MLAEGRVARRINPDSEKSAELLRSLVATTKARCGPFVFTRDGRWALLQGVLIDIRTGHASRLPIPNADSAILDPTGQFIAAREGPASVALWDRSGSKQQRIVDRRPLEVQWWGFSPAANLLALVVRRKDGKEVGKRQIELWPLTATEPVRTIPVNPEGALQFDFSADGRTLAWNCVGQADIHVEGVKESHVVTLPSAAGESTQIAFAISPDAAYLAWTHWYGGAPNDVYVISAKTGESIVQLGTLAPGFIDQLRFSPDGRFLLGDLFGSLWGHTPEATMVWEWRTGHLASWLPGPLFADGLSADDQGADLPQVAARTLAS